MRTRERLADEQTRHNQAQEAIGRTQASAAMSQAKASLMNASTQQSALAESIRHSSAVEAETSRHNKQLELMQGFDSATKRLEARSNSKRAQAALQQSSAAQRQARVAEGKLEVEKEFQPYRKAESLTRTASQGFEAVQSASQAIRSVSGLALSMMGG